MAKEKTFNEMDPEIIKIKEDPEAKPNILINAFVNDDSNQGETQEGVFIGPYEEINIVNAGNGDPLHLVQNIKVEHVEEDPLRCETTNDYINIKPKTELENLDNEIEAIVKQEIPAYSVTVEDFEKMGQNTGSTANENVVLTAIKQDAGVGCNLDETDGSFFNHCPHCNRYEETIASFLNHDCVIKVNSRECLICNRISKTIKLLKNHLFAVHSNIIRASVTLNRTLPFECKLCKKTFESAYRLRVHKFIHELIKSYRCRICSKTFAKFENLVKHKSTHPNIVKPGEKSSNELERHQEEHSSHLASHCKFCDVSYGIKTCYGNDATKKHLNDQLSFICVECRQVFTKSVLLEHHIQKMHQ